ncbi:MAG TPA: hypothetical protein VHC22_32600 [Pirellulales bacterium]|nr:hypothetical protein [Pirellulales bacterium]
MRLSYLTAFLIGWCAADCIAADNFVSGISNEADRKVTGIVNQFDQAAARVASRGVSSSGNPFGVLGQSAQSLNVSTPGLFQLTGHSSRRSVCNHRQVAVAQNVVAVPNGFVVTPLAIPVGVPVASQSYVQYGSSASATVGYGSAIQANTYAPPIAADPRIAPGVCRCGQNTHAMPTLQQYQQSGCAASACQQPGPPTQPSAQAEHATPAAPDQPAVLSLLRQYCSKCHTGDAAKGGFRIDLSLTCEQKLAAIGAILQDAPEKRMPKGVQLDPQMIGQLIQELSR